MAVLPTRDAVILPGAVNELAVGRAGSVAALRSAAENDGHVVVLLQRRASIDEPGPEDLHPVGTLCRVLDAERQSADSASIGMVGVDRVRVLSVDRSGDALFAQVESMEWKPVEPEMSEVLRESLVAIIDQGLRIQFSGRTLGALRAENVIERLCVLSVVAPMSPAELQVVLEHGDLKPVVEALMVLEDDSWFTRFVWWLRK